jgi:hypothetical protein
VKWYDLSILKSEGYVDKKSAGSPWTNQLLLKRNAAVRYGIFDLPDILGFEALFESRIDYALLQSCAKAF